MLLKKDYNNNVDYEKHDWLSPSLSNYTFLFVNEVIGLGSCEKLLSSAISCLMREEIQSSPVLEIHDYYC